MTVFWKPRLWELDLWRPDLWNLPVIVEAVGYANRRGDKPGRRRTVAVGAAVTKAKVITTARARRGMVSKSKIVEAVGHAGKGDKPGRKRTVAVGKSILETQDAQDAQRRGQQFGPKHNRRDVLARLIDDGLAKLGVGATAEATLGFIRATGVAEVDLDDAIFWKDQAGHDRTTTFKSFRNRLAARRKLFKK